MPYDPSDSASTAPDATGAGADRAADADGLVSRLRVIEDQPLETRADAYTALHAELKAVLDSADRVGTERAAG